MKKGFTLIELLIVVAIIAILAAIAIPNFLAAQVRAKVSRVKSELRTLGTGLETYYVDENAYPPEYLLAGNPGVEMLRIAKAYTHLTTPVAYITSFPRDPFKTSGRWSDPPMYWYYNWHERYQKQVNPAQLFSFAAGRPWWNMDMSGIVMSVGPFGETHTNGWDTYDPTNGTISIGYIIRAFPGSQIGN